MKTLPSLEEVSIMKVQGVTFNPEFPNEFKGRTMDVLFEGGHTKVRGFTVVSERGTDYVQVRIQLSVNYSFTQDQDLQLLELLQSRVREVV